MQHHRRKSGYASGNTSLTDVRKAVTASDPSYKKHSSRPSMSRKITPQAVPKLGKSPRDREKEWEEDRWWDEERESFPQYWYVIITRYLTVALFFFLRFCYVSQFCLLGSFPLKRLSLFICLHPSPDMQVTCATPEPGPLGRKKRGKAEQAGSICGSAGRSFLHTPCLCVTSEEPALTGPVRSMICEKQFVPTDDQFLYCSARCRMHDQNSAGSSAAPNRYGTSHPATQYPFFSGPPEHRDIIPRASPSRAPSSTQLSPPTTPAMQSAISALKSLSIRPPSPTSPVGTYHSSIWPFGRSATSPSTSYSKPTTIFSSTYDGTYYGTGAVDSYGTSSDRPLPSRRPGTYSRPKSIELVTPMLGR